MISLLYLPYGPLERPSLAVALLKAALQRQGLPCQVHYLNFDFAASIGVDAYRSLTFVREEMIGEWTFARAAFPGFDGDSEGYLARVEESFGRADIPAMLREVRRLADAFLAEAVERVLTEGPRLVACSSTFNQNCAVLAFTRLLKARAPEVVTVVGGANCEGPMGLAMARAFPWLDYVVSGEGDLAFPELCAQVLEGRAGELPAGVLTAHSTAPARGRTADLKDLPWPDFDDYFEALQRFRFRERIEPALIAETSRGCWWGAVHHCTFCGLNGGTMNFRSKAPDRALAELRGLSERYGLRRYMMADNILDSRYYRDLLPRLAQEPEPFSFFYEIKANVRHDHLVALRDAGVTWIQPGIESLHDEALRLVDKGTTGWQNIQLLKWSRELGLHVSWNSLCGFPEESDAWYAEMASWVPLLHHLQAPKELRPIRFDRFSPYQESPERYGLDLRPVWPMAHLYPLPEAELAQLTYIFEDAGRAPLRTSSFRYWHDREVASPYTGPGQEALAEALREWAALFQRELPPVLAMTEEPDCTEFYDTRRVAPARRVSVSGLRHRVHRALDRAQTVASLAQELEVPPADVSEALQELQAARLVIGLGSRYLALAVRGEIPSLPRSTEDGHPGGWIRPPSLVGRPC